MKIVFSSIFVSVFVVFVLLGHSFVHAVFEKDLYFGIRHSQEVVQLQDFLRNQNFFSEEPTGNFFNLTQKAVQNFQKSQGINTTGYFGSQTRTAALKLLGGSSFNKNASFKLLFPNQTQNFVENQPLTIKWISENYPNNSGVDIYLLKQVASTPKTFNFVKNIKINILNDGEEVWIPTANEIGDNMVIQIGCGEIKINGCVAAVSNNPFSLTHVKTSNKKSGTANIIESFQQ